MIGRLARDEHEAWTDVVRLLQKCGAVTDEDCAWPREGEPRTPGQLLFAALSRWHDAVVALYTDPGSR